MKLCITGANSSVGRNLLQHVAKRSSLAATALVRSPAQCDALPRAANIQPAAVSYDDHDALTAVCRGADAIVHLAGILFENKGSTYQSANVDSTRAIVRAAQQAGMPRMVFISVLGADANSSNPFYRSKGQAEQLVTGSGLIATVLRTPLLLGPECAGGKALLREAQGGKAKLLGGGRHQVRPLDVDDLSAAILSACQQDSGTRVLELCGPQRVAYRELVTQLATMLDRNVNVASVPLLPVKLLSRITHALKGGGMSPAIIDVITASEDIFRNADEELSITLTPLPQTLAKLRARKNHE